MADNWPGTLVIIFYYRLCLIVTRVFVFVYLCVCLDSVSTKGAGFFGFVFTQPTELSEGLFLILPDALLKHGFFFTPSLFFLILSFF